MNGCSIFKVLSVRCHGNCLSVILVASKCKGDLSLTLGGVERILLQPIDMWTISRGKMCSYCSCSSFRLGFGCSTRSFQANNEVQLYSSHGWSGGPCIQQGKPHHYEHVDMCVGGRSMHLNFYLIPFRNTWSW